MLALRDQERQPHSRGIVCQRWIRRKVSLVLSLAIYTLPFLLAITDCFPSSTVRPMRIVLSSSTFSTSTATLKTKSRRSHFNQCISNRITKLYNRVLT